MFFEVCVRPSLLTKHHTHTTHTYITRHAQPSQGSRAIGARIECLCVLGHRCVVGHFRSCSGSTGGERCVYACVQHPDTNSHTLSRSHIITRTYTHTYNLPLSYTYTQKTMPPPPLPSYLQNPSRSSARISPNRPTNARRPSMRRWLCKEGGTLGSSSCGRRGNRWGTPCTSGGVGEFSIFGTGGWSVYACVCKRDRRLA